MTIDQLFGQYSSELVQTARDAEYFDIIRYRKEYFGVYKFIKNYLCRDDWRTRKAVSDIYESYRKLFTEILSEKEKQDIV